MPGTKFWLLPYLSTEHCEPLWLVGAAATEDEANMTWSAFIVSVLLGSDYFGEPALEKPAAASRTRLRDKSSVPDAATVSFTVPVLVNNVALDADAVLLQHKAPRPKRSKPAGPITIDAVQKRSR